MKFAWRPLAVASATFYLSAGIINQVSAETFINVEAKLKHDNNLTSARYSQDIVGDSAVVLGASAGNYFQLDDYDSLRVQGELNAEAYNTYHGMNNISLGANLTLKRKWGLGLYEPWSAIALSAARLDYNNNVRDGWLYTAQIGAGKRITERWNLGVNLSLQKRTQDNELVITPGISGAPFNLTNHSIAFNADYAFNEYTFLTLDYQWQGGDVVASKITVSPLHASFDAVTTAETLDTAFGFVGEAYRLSGTKHLLGVGIHTEITPNCALGFEYQRSITYGAGGNNYYKSLPALTFFYSF